MAYLSVSGISLTIGSQQILKNVSFEVEHGEVIGLIGPNGSGKTTLFNVLSGFLRPLCGTVSLNGTDITNFSPARRGRIGVGRVFQNFGIFRDMTLEENVLVALEAIPKEQRKRNGMKDLRFRASEALDLVGLKIRAEEKASSLSGGQMRLLEIVRTLAAGKELFLLDEPTAGVSPKMTKDVALLIRKLKEQKKTVLIIEHDLPFISTICDRVIVLDVGEIALTGTPKEVHGNRKLQEIYFGADPTE